MKRNAMKPRLALVLAFAWLGILSGCEQGSPTGDNGGPQGGPGGGKGKPINVSNPETRLAPGGLEWTRRESGTQSGLISVTSGKGKIVIAGNNGVILASADGVGWALRNVGRNVALNHVIWTGTKFIAVGDSGTVATSPDGEQWTLRNHSPDHHLESVAWNGKAFVAVGGLFVHSGLSMPAMLTSADGETWTEDSHGHGIFFGAAFGGIGFLAVGFNYDFTTMSDNSTPVMYFSRDGSEWDVINADIESHNAFAHVIHDGRRFVAVGGSRNVNDSFATVYTTSGYGPWARASVPTRRTLEGVAFTGSEYVAVGGKGTIVMSDTSARNWKARVSGVNARLNAVAATSVGWQLVAVGDSGTIVTSPCGRSEAVPPAAHPLVGHWKLVKDALRNADGTESPPPQTGLPEMILEFRGDGSATLAFFEGNGLLGSQEGTWSISGPRFRMGFDGADGSESDYTLSGDRFTMTFEDLQSGPGVKRVWVWERL